MTTPIAPRTVVEAFLPASGPVGLADVYDGANLAGIADQPLRLAIRRLISSGDVVQHGRGRAGTLTLTAAGRRRLDLDRQSLHLAFAQDAGEAPWDGRWRLVAVSVPEHERAVRDALRRELAGLGAVAISTSLHVSPHDLLGALDGDHTRYLSSATTTDLTVRGTSDPRAIAELLWPAAPVVAAYSDLEEALALDDAETSAPALLRQLRLADALELAMRDDPLLPPELRRAPWPPSRTRAAWVRRWEALDHAEGSALFPGW